MEEGKNLQDLLHDLYKLEKTASTTDLRKVIKKLEKMKIEAEHRDREEIKRVERIKKQQRRKQQKMEEEEHIKEATSMDLPMDWENAFDANPVIVGVHADSISDGLILSLSNLGHVDIEYIAAITGERLSLIHI